MKQNQIEMLEKKKRFIEMEKKRKTPQQSRQ